MKKERFASLLLCFCLTLTTLTACKDPTTSSAESKASSAESESSQDEEGINITIGQTEFAVSVHNTVLGEADTALYDRAYRKDGAVSLYAETTPEGYTAISVRTSRDSAGTFSSSILSKDTAASAVAIPVNGFVLLVKTALLGETALKVGNKVETSGYDMPGFERLDLSSFVPEDKTKSRRINLVDPDNKTFQDGKIYYLTKAYSAAVPVNAVALTLKENGSGVFTVQETLEAGSEVSGTAALLFCGDYNQAYAKEFFKSGEKFQFIRPEQLNSVTDGAAVILDDILYPLAEENGNGTGKDGIFLYNDSYQSLVTPAHGDADFRDYVVLENKIVYIGETNTRTLIPTMRGFTLTFAGDAMAKADGLSFGDEIKTLLVEESSSAASYAKINQTSFPFSGRNGVCGENAQIMLFTPAFGATTESVSCLDIVIEGGKVTSVASEGNAAIPANGCVVSVYTTSQFIGSARKIEVGDEALVSVAGSDYGYSSLQYTRINGIRETDTLIIYDGKAGKTTGTNIYGYEILVNADGKMCAESYEGNAKIPEGGYVLSGHGASMTALEEAYTLGASVSYENGTVSILKTPDLALTSAEFTLESAVEQYESAKAHYLSIDYAALDPSMKTAEEAVEAVRKLFREGSPDEAVLLAADVTDRVEKLTMQMYESAAVENRAVWYRSSEKSDEEVRATIEKIKALNINAIYLETWYNGKVIGYSDNELINHNTANGDYDALEGFCRIAHENGIEVHAWVENFFIGTNGSLVDATAGAHCIDRAGSNVFPNEYGNFVFLDPYTRSNRDLVLSVYREIMEKYDIDGLHLDYIRFSEPNRTTGDDFGYNDDIIAGFKEAYNTTVDPHDLNENSGAMWKNWCKFREDIINSFVGEVYDLVQTMKPELWMSAACYPDFYASPTINYQNFRNWVDNGWMDEIFSMSYSTNYEFPIGNASDYASAIHGRCFYSTGLSVFGTTKADMLVKQVEGAMKEAGSSGSNLFSWGSLVGNPYHYTEALAAGVYAKPAEQLYHYGKTVSSFADALERDIDSVYLLLNPGQKDFLEGLRTRLQALSASAQTFDAASATMQQKDDYCVQALATLSDLQESIASCEDDAMKAALAQKASVVETALNICRTRLAKHLTAKVG